MATLKVYVGEDQLLPDNKGVGFFGDDGFGDPVEKGLYNGRTFVVGASGTAESFECNNNKWLSSNEVINGQIGSGILLDALPNYLTTVNLRFEHSVSVQVVDAKFYIYDGSTSGGEPNKNSAPTGLSVYCYETRHTDNIQTANGLNPIKIWQLTGGETYLNLVTSPGTSGYRTLGSFTTDTRHDWYVAISATPTLFGNKSFGMYSEIEFL
jgi:hypothetical protein